MFSFSLKIVKHLLLNGTWRFPIQKIIYIKVYRYFSGTNRLLVHTKLFVRSNLYNTTHEVRILCILITKSQINVMRCQYRFQNATWCSQDWKYFLYLKSKIILFFIFYVGIKKFDLKFSVKSTKFGFASYFSERANKRNK